MTFKFKSKTIVVLELEMWFQLLCHLCMMVGCM